MANFTLIPSFPHFVLLEMNTKIDEEKLLQFFLKLFQMKISSKRMFEKERERWWKRVNESNFQ